MSTREGCDLQIVAALPAGGGVVRGEQSTDGSRPSSRSALGPSSVLHPARSRALPQGPSPACPLSPVFPISWVTLFRHDLSTLSKTDSFQE